MPTVAWILFTLYVLIVAGAGALLRPLWRLTRRDPTMRPYLVMWAVLTGVAATVPVVILVTGRTGWYPGAAGATVFAVSVGFAWTRRQQVLRALRPADEETGGPAAGDRP